MRTLDFKLLTIEGALIQCFTVTLDSYLFHQILHEDGDVLCIYIWINHWGAGAPLAVLAEAPHFNLALPVHQGHVKDHHHSVGRPGSAAPGALEPFRDKWH